jgi:hypothetical protein
MSSRPSEANIQPSVSGRGREHPKSAKATTTDCRALRATTVEHEALPLPKLTEVLMWWEKVPDTPTARKIMKGWVYEVAEDADYNAGIPDHENALFVRRRPRMLARPKV